MVVTVVNRAVDGVNSPCTCTIYVLGFHTVSVHPVCLLTIIIIVVAVQQLGRGGGKGLTEIWKKKKKSKPLLK